MQQHRIIVTRGLPASGKSSWARMKLAEEPGVYKIIEKDALRLLLDGGVWSKANEKFVLKMRDAMIVATLEAGFVPIVCDTNFAPKHLESIAALAKHFNAVLTIQDFTHVDVEECIRRDQKRVNYVGEKTIRKMYDQYLRPDPPVIERIEGRLMAVICDLDGTLCLFGEENPFDRDFSKDLENEPVAAVLRSLDLYQELIITSGRSDKHAEATVAWLHRHDIRFDQLHMRKEGDFRKDVIVKREMYEEHIQGKFNVLFVLDDRSSVVRLWRSLGLVCLQCAEGDF